MRLAIALWLSSPIAIALVLCALNRRTLFGDAADELSDISADEGWGVINHSQLATNRERNDHA